MAMTVFLVTPSGREEIVVECDDTVLTLKEKVAKVLQLAQGEVGLRVAGVALDDDTQGLCDVGVWEGCDIEAYDKWILVMGTGGWGLCNEGLSVEENRVTVVSPGIHSYNALWTRPVCLSGTQQCVKLSVTMHSNRPMDHRHMLGLIPMSTYENSGYLDTADCGCIAYEVSGLLVTKLEAHRTEPVSTSGPVRIDLTIDCSTRCIAVAVDGQPVVNGVLRYWPTEPLHPFVTLNAIEDYAEPAVETC